MGDPVVYVAGPYRAATPGLVAINVSRAERAAMDLLSRGYNVICPHTMMAGWDADDMLDDDAFLRNGLALLARCDAVYVVARAARTSDGAWFVSEGTRAEIGLAQRRGIPCFEAVELLNCWRKREFAGG